MGRCTATCVGDAVMITEEFPSLQHVERKYMLMRIYWFYVEQGWENDDQVRDGLLAMTEADVLSGRRVGRRTLQELRTVMDANDWGYIGKVWAAQKMKCLSDRERIVWQKHVAHRLVDAIKEYVRCFERDEHLDYVCEQAKNERQELSRKLLELPYG